MTTITITSRWTTIYTRGYQSSVNSRDENRAAHGAVCHTQLRKTRDGRTVARQVNTNGRHTEESKPWEPSAAELADMMARAE